MSIQIMHGVQIGPSRSYMRAGEHEITYLYQDDGTQYVYLWGTEEMLGALENDKPLGAQLVAIAMANGVIQQSRSR